MEINIKQLPDNPKLLQEMLVHMHQELNAYKEKYASLIEQLRLAKQHRFASSSEKNVLQADLFDEAGSEITLEVQQQLDEQITVNSYARSKHPVRKPLPKELPREVIVHDLTAPEKVCSCGVGLMKIGEEITEQLKFIPAKLSVIQHVRYKYACKPCQETVRVAPMPKLLLPKSIATPELVAHIITAKYVDHIPLYRQEAIWQRLDIDLPRSSLCGWILKTAECCEPLVHLLKQAIILYDYTQADETPVEVLNEANRHNQTKSFMWVYRGGEPAHRSIVFDYQETRGGQHAQTFLKGFKGFLQTDAYSGYAWGLQDEAITSIGCMAHARRSFAELAKLTNGHSLAKEALTYFQKVYGIEKQARENNCSPRERHAQRNAHAPLILTEFKQWLEHHLTKVPQQHKIGQAIQYVLRHWEPLTNYLKDGRIEIDNNAIENAIRPFAIGRKNFLFMGSPRGAKAGAILYSLIETCKANKIEPYQYFSTMLNRLPHSKTADDYQRLLPQTIQL
jgi:transposase